MSSNNNELHAFIFTEFFPSSAGHTTLQWRQNERDGVSNYQPHDCLLNRLFKHRWMKISKLRVTGLCAGNSPVWPVNSPHKRLVAQKRSPFEDVIMKCERETKIFHVCDFTCLMNMVNQSKLHSCTRFRIDAFGPNQMISLTVCDTVTRNIVTFPVSNLMKSIFVVHESLAIFFTKCQWCNWIGKPTNVLLSS